MSKQFSPKTIALVFSILVICSVASFYAAAWTEPTAVAPGNNAATPLDTSNVGQTKVGGLVLNTGAATYGLIVQSGNVGIGTATPGAKLEVAGQVKITGGTPGTDKVLVSDSSGLAGWEQSTYTYYCFTDNSQNGLPVCTNAGGTQGHCPAGSVEKRGLGSFGNCVSSTGYYSGYFLPGGRCLSNGQGFVRGQAFLCTVKDKAKTGDKTVFVTSGTYTGNLGGIAGANSICQSAATSAGLSGTYYAWIAGSYADDPYIRFNKTFDRYVLRNGTVVANDWYDLIDGTLTNPINIDQNGSTVSGNVWTGSHYYGWGFNSTGDGVSCLIWTAADTNTGYYGQVSQTNNDWSDKTTSACTNSYHLYCFQQ